MRPNRRTVRASAVALTLVVLFGLTGCQTARVGRSCRGTGFAHNSTHVLKCVKKRWVRVMTNAQALTAWRAVLDAQARAAIPPTTSVPAPVVAPTTTVDPAPPSTAVAVSAGGEHACALMLDRTVRCWGANLDGQLGDGTTVDRLSPVRVVGVNDAVEISAGKKHTCALRASGGVWCWGSNKYGQLGIGGSFDNRLGVYVLQPGTSTPVIVPGVEDATHIEVSGESSCALQRTGFVPCWGLTYTNRGTETIYSFNPGPINADEGAGERRLIVATDISVATDASLCWTGTDELERCRGGTQRRDLSAVELGTRVSAGDFGECGIMGDGAVECVDHVPYVPTRLTIAGVNAPDVIDVWTGHSGCALTAGLVSCWGDNDEGQLGDGTTMSRPGAVGVTGLSSVRSLSVGGPSGSFRYAQYFGCAVLAGGEVRCWGSNGAGQLGDGTVVNRLVPTPVIVV